ncbi:hypothetical protein BJV74DRAFT_798623 [Russula compacta]|nr:hypothetical protein BJV74DRAFT_798623 [Russula compacta]
MSPSNNDSLPSDEQGSTYNSEELESDNSVNLMPSTQISPNMLKAELLKLLKTAQLQNSRINKQYRRLRINYKNKGGHTEYAITTEVYTSITPELQAALKNESHRQSFIDIFLYHLKQEHSNIMHMAHDVAAGLLGLRATHLSSCHNPTLAQELEQLLQNPTKPDEKIILHRKSAIDSSGLGWCPNKALLWGVMETTPGMITLTATVLTFVCGPDQTFTQKTKGESKITWKMCFLQYKQTILCFLSSYCKHLLAFYDVHIFGESLISVPESLELTETALNDIDDVLQHLDNMDEAMLSTPPAQSPALPPPSSVHADTTPIHTTLNDVDTSANNMALDPPLPPASTPNPEDKALRFICKMKGKEPIWPQPRCISKRRA